MVVPSTRRWLRTALIVVVAVCCFTIMYPNYPSKADDGKLSRTTAALMEMQARQDAEHGGVPDGTLSAYDPLTAPKQALSKRISVHPQTIDGTMAAQTLDFNFLSVNYTQDGTSSAAFPPDTMGAIGPSQFFTTINGRFRVHNKATGGIVALNVDSLTFWSAVRDGRSVRYPRLRFDRFTNRWIAVIATVEVANRVLIATSDSPTISAGTVWTYSTFTNTAVNGSGQPCFADFPSLGVDVHALYIGVNQRCGVDVGSASPNGSDVFVVRKSTIFAGGGALVVTAFADVGLTSPQGVDNFDASAAQGYVVGTIAGDFTHLGMRRVNTPAATPSLSELITIAVPTTSEPIHMPHKGSTGALLDALDRRLSAAVIRNGSLWTAQQMQVNSSGTADSVGGRNGLRWYHIGNLDAMPSLVQTGTVFDVTAVNPVSYSYPSLMVNGQGHTAIGFTITGSNHFADAGFTGRLVSDPAGTMPYAVVNITNTSAAYNPPQDTSSPRQWGSYSATSLDPCDDMTMWTIQEYTASADTWGVRVAKLMAPPPAAIVSVSPSTIPRGLAAVKLTITGADYYDPAANVSCRLQASIAGLTVMSMQYNSPTSITLTVNTTGASLGTKDLTITNPDGQSVTSNGAITIVAGTPETVGIFRPADGTFYLRNSNTTGTADRQISFGLATDLPIVGDWNGDGIDSPGVYRASTGEFFLTDSTHDPAALNYSFVLGVPGDTPIVGDWDGDGKESAGIFRPSNGLIYLRNALTTGFADYTMVLGIPGDVGIAGDWNGDGIDSPGVYRPSNQIFYVTNQVCNCAVFADAQLGFGSAGDVPFVGDWDGNGVTGVGVFRPSNQLTFLRNALTTGFADFTLVYGTTGDKPLAGHWQAGISVLGLDAPEPAPTFVPQR
ncbi:MAG: hypothetical protein KF716_10250 [Anaerolineae bacterium]|nr:hypothetical protein [Anaerolineae bacterium]